MIYKPFVMQTETLKNTDTVSSEECCPRFDPLPWDDTMMTWDNKRFIRDKVRTFFFMPLNFGQVMTRLSRVVTAAGAEMPGWLCLSDHTSRWNMDVYLEVNKQIAAADNVLLSGNYYSKVYEGPYKDTGKWGVDFNKTLSEKGMKYDKLYMWYTTCPKCAKKYGKNYTVFIAKVHPQQA